MSTSPNTMPPEIANGYIVSRPDVCGGKPCIDGTRIRVQDIAILSEFGGLSPEGIVREFPQISLAQVHGALAYYFDHLAAIRADIEDSEKIAEVMKARYGSPLEEKLVRLRGQDAAHDPISSR